MVEIEKVVDGKALSCKADLSAVWESWNLIEEDNCFSLVKSFLKNFKTKTRKNLVKNEYS